MSTPELPDSGPAFRDAYAPELAPVARRQLAGGGDPYPVALVWVVAVLFGVAGTAVLASGAAPSGASPVLFDAVVGGGGLVVAVAAALAAVRGTAGLRRYRAARRGGLLVTGRELATLAAGDPRLGALVRRTQAAVDRVRSGAGYPGGLSTVLDSATLDRIEWTVVSAAVAADHTTADRLTPEVERLERLADTAQTGAVPGDAAHPVSELADELDRVALVAAEFERLHRRDT